MVTEAAKNVMNQGDVRLGVGTLVERIFHQG